MPTPRLPAPPMATRNMRPTMMPPGMAATSLCTSRAATPAPKKAPGFPVPSFLTPLGDLLDDDHGAAFGLVDVNAAALDVTLRVELHAAEDAGEGVAAEVADDVVARDLAVAVDLRVLDRLQQHLRRLVGGAVEGTGLADRIGTVGRLELVDIRLRG